MRDHAGDSSCPSVPSCLSPNCIGVRNCSLLISMLSRNLLDRISAENADPQGDLDD